MAALGSGGCTSASVCAELGTSGGVGVQIGTSAAACAEFYSLLFVQGGHPFHMKRYSFKRSQPGGCPFEERGSFDANSTVQELFDIKAACRALFDDSDAESGDYF